MGSPITLFDIAYAASMFAPIVRVRSLESVDRDQDSAAEAARLHGFDGAVLQSSPNRGFRQAGQFGKFSGG